MTQFDYISIALSMLVAFAMAQILSGWGELIGERGRVRFWWPHTLWTALIMLLLIQIWWGFWGAHTVETWSFFAFVVLMAQPLSIILALFVFMPHLTAERGELDLREHYWRNHREFFLLGALVVVLLTFGGIVMAGAPALSVENGVRLLAIALLVSLAFSRSERYHQGVLVALCLLLAIFIARIGMTAH